MFHDFVVRLRHCRICVRGFMWYQVGVTTIIARAWICLRHCILGLLDNDSEEQFKLSRHDHSSPRRVDWILRSHSLFVLYLLEVRIKLSRSQGQAMLTSISNRLSFLLVNKGFPSHRRRKCYVAVTPDPTFFLPMPVSNFQKSTEESTLTNYQSETGRRWYNVKFGDGPQSRIEMYATTNPTSSYGWVCILGYHWKFSEPQAG